MLRRCVTSTSAIRVQSAPVAVAVTGGVKPIASSFRSWHYGYGHGSGHMRRMATATTSSSPITIKHGSMSNYSTPTSSLLVTAAGIRTLTTSTSSPSSVSPSSMSSSSPFVSNVSSAIEGRIGRNLHLQKNHPINIVKRRIETYFTTHTNFITNHHNNNKDKDNKGDKDNKDDTLFKCFDNKHPRVTTTQCFDDLLVPPGHVSRSLTDTFYYDQHTILRPHTSAHQTEFLRQGHRAFLVTGDCYRRDEIDATHYPVFHQMEGVRVFDPSHINVNDSSAVVTDLKKSLEGMVETLFGKVEMRWVDASFPFTDPSLELEVFYNGKWLEVLGCGVIQRGVLAKCGLSDRIGWAFGIGIERLAMVLFDIPDIRLFWSTDKRFLDQFTSDRIVKFQPFSKYPGCWKDISLWIPNDWHHNDIAAVVRDIAGDMVESVVVKDEFTNGAGRQSKTYRITYRSLSHTLLNEEVDAIQMKVRHQISLRHGVQLR